MFSRPGARDARRAAHPLKLGAVLRAALLFGAPIVPSAIVAQDPDPGPPSPSALYATIGGVAARPRSGFERTGGEAAGITIAGVLPFPRGESWIGRSLGLRLEFSEVTYADAPYVGGDPAYAGDRIQAGIRTHALGVQLTRPGQVHVRPYASVAVSEVKMLLDADEAGKLDRRSGGGMIARAGSYLAFTRGPTPFVLELTAAYHENGTRDHWSEGRVTAVRGPADFLELSVQVGVGVHTIWPVP